MSLNILVSFEPLKNLVHFDIDVSEISNRQGLPHPIANAFPELTSQQWDDVYALGDGTTNEVKITDTMSEWRHRARVIARGMSVGHLWGLTDSDCTLVWSDVQGNTYTSPSDIPGAPDTVHTLGTTPINDFLRVGDPCYKWKESEATQVKVLPGQWVFELTMRDDSAHGMANGHSNARLVAYHRDAGPLDLNTLLSQAKPLAQCSVDSAMCGFMFDAPMPQEGNDKEAWYDALTDGALDPKNYAPKAHFAPQLNAVLASTFYGDGGYPMLVQYNAQGQATAVALVTDPMDPLLRKNPHIDYDEDEPMP